MGMVIRQGFWNSVNNYCGMLLGYLNVGFLFPLIFSEDQFGLTRVLLALSGTIVAFSQISVPSATIRFFPFFRTKDKRHGGFLFFVLFIPTIILFAIAVGLYAFKGLLIQSYTTDSILFAVYFNHIILLVIAQLYFRVLEYYCRSLYITAPPTFFREVFTRIVLFVAIIFFYLGYLDFDSFMIMFTASYVIALIALIGLLISKGEFNVKPDWSFFRDPRFKEIRHFSLYNFAQETSFTITEKLDVLMVGAMIGLDGAGIYALAFLFANIINIPAVSLMPILMPMVADAFSKKDMERIHIVYKKMAINGLILGGLFFVIIWSSAVDLLTLVKKPEYLKGEYVIFFIAITRLIALATSINRDIIVISSFYRIELFFNLSFLVLTVVTNVIFINLFGLPGAAIATAISLGFNDLARVYVVGKKFKIYPFTYKMIFLVVLISVLATGGRYLPALENNYFTILYRSAILGVVYLGLTYIFRLSSDLNDVVGKLIARI